MKSIGSVAIGAVLGSVFRYCVSLITYHAIFPVGTLIVNVSGSMFLGLFMGLFIYYTTKKWLKDGLGAGLCGGYTTMSTFASDSVALIFEEKWSFLIIYVIGNVLGGVAGAMI